jgi:hypothetical protein
MQQPASDPPAELPIWKGRRGLINTALCLALSLPCAFGVWFLVERTTIVPACSAYASAHGMSYADFKLTGVKEKSTVVCVFAQGSGRPAEIHLNELVSTLTDIWVGFAMALEFTIPAFAILLALLRVAWYRVAGF